jgi:autotransporter-associated beta strand protein
MEVGIGGTSAMAITSLAMNAGSTLYFELGEAADSIAMTGAFSVAGSSTLNLTYLTGFVNTADYTLMTYTSMTGLADLHYAALPSNYALVETGTQLILDYTAPPIPTNVDATWNVDADGLWMADSNWTPSAPKTADSTAMFGSVVTTNCLITVDAPVTLASMMFDNANSYTIAGSGITLSGTAVGIAVTNGSHTISAPVALTAATPVTVQAGAALTMGDISGSSDLTKAGAGTLKLVGLVTNSGITNVNAGTLIVNGTMDAQTAAVNVATSATLGGNGTINRPVVAAASAIIAPGESIGTLSAAAVTMQAGSLLDIQITDGSADRLAVAGTFDVAGDLKVTYSTSTVVASTQTYSVATFASVNGDFANVMVDAQYIGHNIGALYIAKGMDADSYDVTVKPFMAGDANLDGQVKIGDLVTLAQHWNQASGATWFDGDANGDGQIKIGDLVALAQNWNKTVTAGGAVPEPLTLTVLGLGGLAILRRRSGK